MSITINETHWKIEKAVNCNTYNSVYAIICKKETCGKVYIGETKNSIKDRMSEHIGYAKTKKLDLATGNHFNKPGHSIANMQITLLEKMNIHY